MRIPPKRNAKKSPKWNNGLGMVEVRNVIVRWTGRPKEEIEDEVAQEK